MGWYEEVVDECMWNGGENEGREQRLDREKMGSNGECVFHESKLEQVGQ